MCDLITWLIKRIYAWIALAAIILVLTAAPVARSEDIAKAATQSTTKPEVANKPAVLVPQLRDVCSCEIFHEKGHAFSQFDAEGNVRHGKINPKDIGGCQINEHYNGADARAHGWDIYTADGNIRMANWLFKTQGLTPWNWSKSCWG